MSDTQKDRIVRALARHCEASIATVGPVGRQWLRVESGRSVFLTQRHLRPTRLHPLGIRTTADLVAIVPASARDVGTVVLERLVRELNGIECDEFKPEPEASKATAVTRQFGAPVTDLDELREAMVRRAVRAVEKIRHQGLVATRLIVSAHGSRYRPNPPSASRQTRMSPPSNDPRIIAGLAAKMMEAMYQPGGVYTKCGVLLEELLPQGAGRGTSLPSRIRVRPGCSQPWTASTIGSAAGL
ncbi:hypothetical protein ACVWYO_002280 [Sphingomonas sp. UYP23]